MTPRAFAVSPSGAWCWAEEGEDPDARALAACEKKSNQPCRLYSVDDYVVWKPAPGSPLAEPDTALTSNGGNPAETGAAAATGAVGGTAATAQ
jgi:hypothetical protein